MSESKPRALLSWSSGKDSAWALQRLRERGDVEIVGLLTTVNETFERVAMHAVREELLEAQARAVALPLRKVQIPWPCTNEQYEVAMGRACSEAVGDGVTQVAFGDLFLEDVRDYRVDKLRGTGLTPLFPLWGTPTQELSRRMVDAGLRAHVTCVDPKLLPLDFCGRAFDHDFLDDLPESADPCGENGEFHTFVHAGPMFSEPVAMEPGPVVERDGFVFADLLPVI